MVIFHIADLVGKIVCSNQTKWWCGAQGGGAEEAPFELIHDPRFSQCLLSDQQPPTPNTHTHKHTRLFVVVLVLLLLLLSLLSLVAVVVLVLLLVLVSPDS